MTAFYSPKEVATTLGIQESTLRKYLLRLEARGYEVQRNDQGHRFFQDQDVIALRKLISFKDEKGMTLDESADAVILWKNGNNVDEDITKQEAEPEETLPIPPNALQWMKNMQEWLEIQKKREEHMDAFMESQAQRETALKQELTSMREEMAAMRELIEKQEQEALPEPIPEPKKKGWFGWLKKN